MGGTVVGVGLPAEEFALSETTERFGDLEYEIEQVVAHDDGRVMPYVWIGGLRLGDVKEAIADDDSVKDFERIADVEDKRLYRIDWVARIGTLVQILIEEEGAILSTQGNGDDWTLQILSPSWDTL